MTFFGGVKHPVGTKWLFSEHIKNIQMYVKKKWGKIIPKKHPVGVKWLFLKNKKKLVTFFSGNPDRIGRESLVIF